MTDKSFVPQKPHRPCKRAKRQLSFDDTDAIPSFNYSERDQEFKSVPSEPYATLLEAVRNAAPTLKSNNCIEQLTTFFIEVAHGKFPLDNISFLLFLDTVKFLSLANVSAMR